MNRILVTGAAGFIGSNLVDRLIDEGYEVVGIDNFSGFYDPKIKERNLENAKRSSKFRLYRLDILDFENLKKVFEAERPEKIIHLAARAGVRPSIANPILYGQVNVLGTVNLLKLSVEYKTGQFIYGSSSSVYGNSVKIPFMENDLCENILSPYGASKRSAEFFVQSFNKNFGLKSVILRLFSVYGPRGRPDMAPYLFARAILNGKMIDQYGDGSTSRDYTYVDDVVDGIMLTVKSDFVFEVINLGNNKPVKLGDLISTIERVVGKKAKINRMSRQNGEVERTWANIVKARQLLNWTPATELFEGLSRYIKWLKKKKALLGNE